LKLQSKFASLALLCSIILSACGGGGGNITLDQTMIDTIKGYSEAVMQADTNKLPNYTCEKDVERLKKDFADAGITEPVNLDSHLDFTNAKLTVKNSTADLIRIDTGDNKIQIVFKDGEPREFPIPGSINGVIMKKEGGTWKVCYSESGKV
jgi:hypothetical protein